MAAFHMIEQIILSGSTNVKQHMKVHAVVHKIGTPRGNKKEFLVVDETGSLCIKEWSKTNSFSTDYVQGEVYAFEIRSSLYKDEVYGAFANVALAEENREQELLAWYSTYSKFEEMKMPKVNDLIPCPARISLIRGVIIYFLKPTEENRPTSIIIADETGKCQVIIWNPLENMNEECLGKILIIRNCRNSTQDSDHKISLIVDELSTIIIQSDEQASIWFNEGKYKETCNITPKNTPKKEYPSQSPMKSKSLESTPVVSNRYSTNNKEDESYFKAFEKSYNKINEKNKESLKWKLLKTFEDLPINNSNQLTTAFFQFMEVSYQSISDEGTQRKAKRKLFNLIEDQLDGEEEERKKVKENAMDEEKDE